jgi:hypothetical protein
VALAAIIESGPDPAVHGVVRWRVIDLCQWLWEESHVSITRSTLSRELRNIGYRKLSARPRHHPSAAFHVLRTRNLRCSAQAAGAIEDFKKVSQAAWRKSHMRRASNLMP